MKKAIFPLKFNFLKFLPFLFLLVFVTSCGSFSLLNYNDIGSYYMIDANYLESNKNSIKSIADYDSEIATDPDNIENYYFRALRKYSLMNFEGAIADLDSVINIIGIDNLLNGFFEIEKSYEKVNEKYKKYVIPSNCSNIGRFNPFENVSLANAYFLRGNAKGHIKDYYLAATDFANTVKLCDKFAQAYYYNGISSAIKCNYTAAYRELTKAINIYPDYAEAYNIRGITRVYSDMAYLNGQAKPESGDYFQLALADLNKAIELKPDFGEAYYNRGMAFINIFKISGKRSHRDAACDDWRKALDLGYFKANDMLKMYCR